MGGTPRTPMGPCLHWRGPIKAHVIVVGEYQVELVRAEVRTCVCVCVCVCAMRMHKICEMSGTPMDVWPTTDKPGVAGPSLRFGYCGLKNYIKDETNWTRCV